MEEKSINPIGIYGWRKRCLYCLVLILFVVIVLNISLTVWILVVLKFNIEGMGGVRVTDGGLQVQDTAEFLDTVYLESIKADSKLQIRSQSNISFDASNGPSKVTMDAENITVQSSGFKVQLNSEGQQAAALLSTTSGGNLEMRTGSIHINGSVFGERITTKELYSNEGLLLEGSEVDINASQSIIMSSDTGPIDLLAAGNITLTSGDNGQVILSANSIILEGIPSGLPSTSQTDSAHPVTFNLCVCPNGRLYKVMASIEDSTTNGCRIHENDDDPCNQYT